MLYLIEYDLVKNYYSFMVNYNFIKATNSKEAFQNLYDVISILRSENGCPYDKALNYKDSLQNLIDEAYEYLEGVNNNDISSTREEVGDILLNALMLLKIHEQANDFTPQDALNEVCEKLIRRHPHVFGDVVVHNKEEGLKAYYSVKEGVEKKAKDPIEKISHIPSSLPPLERSFEIQKKLAKTGFDWPNVEGVIDKVNEELEEVKIALENNDRDNLEEEIGDLLTSVINLARFVKVNPAFALERANNKIKNRFTALFTLAKERNIPLDIEHVEQMNELWDEVKLRGI